MCDLACAMEGAVMGGGWWWWWRQGEPWRAGAGRNFFQQQRRALPGMTKKKRVGGDHPRRHRRQQTPAGPPPTSPAPRPDRETGKRPRSEDGPRPSANGGASGPAAAAASIAPHAIQWLERRKKKVPDALRGAVAGASLLDVDGLLGHVAGLRERERRSLVRYVEKCVRDRAGDGAAGGGGSARVELEGSDGEYDADDADGGARRGVGDDWPADVEFSNDYRWDPAVPDDVKREYVPPPGPGGSRRRRAPRPSRRVYVKRIVDPDHPAHGEFGLYCALDRGAPPGSWLLDYVGHVTLGKDQDMRSDYVCDFGERGDLACDARRYGNEARFLNDFRNTGKHPNVEFNTRRDENGELRQGVYVKSKKDARQEGFDGVKRDEELLVSYGKSYWRSRVNNMTDFVWRFPGQPMPEGGKPTA